MFDPTSKRLFFQLLHTARLLKPLSEYSRGFLVGMAFTMDINHKDFTIADNTRDHWRDMADFGALDAAADIRED